MECLPAAAGVYGMEALNACMSGVYVTVPAIGLLLSKNVMVPVGGTPASDPNIWAERVVD